MLDNLAKYNLRSKEGGRGGNGLNRLVYDLDARGMQHRLGRVLVYCQCTHPKSWIAPGCRNCVFYQPVSLPTLVE